MGGTEGRRSRRTVLMYFVVSAFSLCRGRCLGVCICKNSSSQVDSMSQYTNHTTKKRTGQKYRQETTQERRKMRDEVNFENTSKIHF